MIGLCFCTSISSFTSGIFSVGTTSSTGLSSLIFDCKVLQSYVTCEGRYAFIFKYHFRFLQHLSDESKMNLPFFFLKSLQKMSCRVREHLDHIKQSVFHHGLIKLIISTVLQNRGKTWEHFIFWSGFKNDQEG